MNSSTDYVQFDEEQQILRVHSDSAAASLSMADVHPAKQLKSELESQETGIFGSVFSLTGLLVLAAVVTAVEAMYAEGTLFMYICFSGPIILAPVVLYQRSRMESISCKSKNVYE
jgi:hypothetical protein